MTFTFTYAWWWIPAAITAGTVIWLSLPKDHGGNYPDIGSMINLVMGLLIVCFAWAVGGFFK